MLKLALSAAVAALALVATPVLAACDTINSKVLRLSACIEESDWVIQAPQGDQEFLYFSTDDAVGFTIIAEKVVFTAADFRAAVLANAKSANSDTDVRIVKERVENIAEKPWSVIAYEMGAEGQELQFQNFYYSQPGFGAVQVVFWSLPTDATVAAYRAGKLLATLQYGT